MPSAYPTGIPLAKGPPLDRSMPSAQSAASLAPKGSLCGSLYTVNSNCQQYGDYFAGFFWTHFCCGTYRSHTSLDKAGSLMKGYMRRLSKTIRVPIAYIAVSESRPSGLGHHAIRPHWHFLTACPEHRAAEFTHSAWALWTRCYGDLQIKPYDSSLGGAHYIAKLASQSGFDYQVENLDRLGYHGPNDLFTAAKESSYYSRARKGD
jgi:hypothetical protein